MEFKNPLLQAKAKSIQIKKRAKEKYKNELFVPENKVKPQKANKRMSGILIPDNNRRLIKLDRLDSIV